MLRSSILAASLLFSPANLAPASAPLAATCSAPVPVPPSITTPHSTYYNDGSPPVRFAHVPNHAIKMAFGQKSIDSLCGRPPCGMVFVACTSDDGTTMALPDPFTTDPQSFVATLRHELGHVNGWPATHGD